MLALLIVLSASVTAIAVTNKGLLTAIGQNGYDPYAPSIPPYIPTITPTITPTTPPITPPVTPPVTPPETPPVTPGPETPAEPYSDLSRMEADGFITYEFENFRVVHDTNTNTWWFEWDVTNNLDVPITIQPYIALYGCDVRRTGTPPLPGHLPFAFAGESVADEAGSCPARGSSLNMSFASASENIAAGTHDSTVTRLHFQTSTLNIPQTEPAKNAANKTIVGKSVRNKYLKIHPEANKTTTNPTILKKRICTVDSTTPMAVVNGTATTLQPGESTTIRSEVDSSDWGFLCSPVNRGLINYNVQAGSSSYKGLTVDQTIVFGDEESNLCG